MAEGGTWASRLEEEDKKLQAELDLWIQKRMNSGGWRMGDSELLFRCEILVLLEVIQDRFDVSDDEVNCRLKRIIREQLESLRPDVEEQQRQEIRNALLNGIRPQI